MKMLLGIMYFLLLFQNKVYLSKSTDTGYQHFSPETISAIQILMGNRAIFLVPCPSISVRKWKYESHQKYTFCSPKFRFRRPNKPVQCQYSSVFWPGILYSITFSKLQQFYNALRPEQIRSILSSCVITDLFTVVSSPLSFVSNQNGRKS